MNDIQKRIAALPPEKREILSKKLALRLNYDDRQKTSLPQVVNDKLNQYKPFILTSSQRAFMNVQDNPSGSYASSGNIYMFVEVSGVSSLSKLFFKRFLSKGFQQIIEKHEMLRTVLLTDNEQKILEHVPLYKIKYINLRGKSKTEEEILNETRIRMAHKAISISKWPMFEFLVNFLSGRRAVIQFSISSVLADGTSMFYMFNELLQMVKKSEMINIECSYRDYAVKMNEFIDSPLYKKSYNYWMQRLPQIYKEKKLPLMSDSHTLEIIPVQQKKVKLLEAALWDKIIKRARQEGLSTSNIILSTFADTLARWSKTACFSLCVLTSFRPPVHSQIHNLVGNFYTSIVVNIDVKAGSFIERTKLIQQQVVSAMDYPYFSGFDVIKELNKMHGKPSEFRIPVLFNSVIDYTTFNHSEMVMNSKEEKRGVIFKAFKSILKSITPQLSITNMDATFYPTQTFLFPTFSTNEQRGLTCKWQFAEGAFHKVEINNLIEDIKNHLYKLAEEEESWGKLWREDGKEVI